MTANYATHFSTRQTPQSEAIPGKAQVENSAGGFVFQVDDWKRLDRFLILGADGPTFYASEHTLTIENAECVRRCLSEDGIRTVNRIVEISDSGRAPKNDPAIFALAICAGLGSPEARAHALLRMPEVCRIGTHLFSFIECVKGFRGWGPALRKAIAKWYERDDAAFQCVKYQQRNGVSHRDVLRLCHGPALNWPLPRWIVNAGMGSRVVKGRADKKRADREYSAVSGELPAIVQAFEQAKRAKSPTEISRLIYDHNLPREGIPTNWLNDVIVWKALLNKMPLTAMIRNLAKMTAVGLIAPMSAGTGKVIAALSDQEQLQKSRIHPVAVLAAMLTYAQGHGTLGKLEWSPVSQVIDALDGAFYKSFGNVQSTGRRWLLGLDVSGSMDGGTIAGVPGLTPRIGVGALAMVTAAVEPHHMVAFTSGMAGEWSMGSQGSARHGSAFVRYNAGLTPLSISPRQRLGDVCDQMRRLPMGGTDCALPMIYATAQKIPVDVFVVLTDNETFAGNMHPTQALRQYRDRMGIPAKMIVVGMTATQFSIADANDFSTMDVVGFDTATPQLMSSFVADPVQ